MIERDSMAFDVLIIGAGPAGLSTAIRLAQLDSSLRICVLDKAADIGGQILSGAVLEPRALQELLPNWQAEQAPLNTLATQDNFLFLTENKSYQLPTPPQMKNHGNYIISLGKFCQWLANIAENLGVNIFPGFAATEMIYHHHIVRGVITGDKGLNKAGKPGANFQPGMALYAKQTILAEGCRGSLTQTVIAQYALNKDSNPQTYGLGIKEVWEVAENLHQPGLVTHTIGWPLNHTTYGGSFIYHYGKNLVAMGFVIGLDYQNPYLNPYEEFQRFKTHPRIQPLLKSGKRIAYGARCLNEGGFQSLPKLTFPGGLLVGCAAGFLNVPKIKGIHTAMKSGMIAAESIYPYLKSDTYFECTDYFENLKKSWIWSELYRARNIRPAMNWGLLPGLAYAALDTYVLRGYAPWTLRNHADYLQLKKATTAHQLEYPKHDNKITFDLMSSVFLTNSVHDENQPCHLKLKNPNLPVRVNLKEYAGPEQRYCPAGVYEYLFDEMQQPYLQINAANCIQCKACDIKDPRQNIVWTPPEGGSGPQYYEM